MHTQKLLAAAALFALAQTAAAQTAPELSWPTPTMENKLWSRWWWMGNAVDEKNLTRQLEQFQQAGLGGTEICPIYGVYGSENRYLNFLSPQWMSMLAHTARESKRLGIGLDMTTGTGWPFGGNMVTDTDASKGIVLKAFDRLPDLKEIPAGKPLYVMAYVPNQPAPTDITEPLLSGADIKPFPAGTRFVAALQTGPQQKVKRPAPGAEGNVLDPYSTDALSRYLNVFDTAFKTYDAPFPRTQFHDSFEYYNATWTPTFFDEFQKRRGYDLRPHLRELNNEGDKETIARIKCDYRETLSDLHLEYMNKWVSWTHTHNMLGRNQAHGGPGNILDVYANADIPECEVFHLYDESQLPFLKLASSAAHVTGKRLTSSETFTWLDEHFNASLAQVKTEADFIFLAGVNHMFLHGIPYSPEDAAWPGWNFYASVNFGPTGGLWRDFPAFTAYVARVQSILQANKPSNDILLYVPWHEFWSDPKNNDKLMVQFTTPGDWMKPYAFYDVASALQNNGNQYDEVSDALLQHAKVNADNTIDLGGNSYRVVVVPKTPVMPVETLQKLMELVKAGATVVFQEAIPADVPGFNDLTPRRAQLKALTPQLVGIGQRGPQVQMGGKGGKIYVAQKLRPDASAPTDLLSVLPSPEPMHEAGLRYIRRARPDGYDYFIVNRSDKTVDKVVIGNRPKSVVILDPRAPGRAGVVRPFDFSTGPAPEVLPHTTTLPLHVAPGESYIVRTYTEKAIEGPAWRDLFVAGNAAPIHGIWNISFIDGGPVLPKPYTQIADATGQLTSWISANPDPDAQRFAGTAKYSLTFTMPPSGADAPVGRPAIADYQLNLGKIGDSARVTLNGKPLGTLWAEPFSITLGVALKPGENKLEIEVTNVAANRIRDMDRRGVQWKIFRDANVLSTAYTGFDASNWALRPAGLLGPVSLTPLAAIDPQK